MVFRSLLHSGTADVSFARAHPRIAYGSTFGSRSPCSWMKPLASACT